MSDTKPTLGMLMGIFNEAERIVSCLNHHAAYMDEIVIVIQKSDDGTEQIVDEYITNHPEYKITVLHYPLMGSSEATLQFGADTLTTDWILYVDADEQFPKPFLKKAHEIISKATVDGFWFERDNYFIVPCFNEAVPIEPKTVTIKHPTRDRQFRLTRKSMTWFPPQVHVRARVRGKLANETIEEKTDTLDYTMYHLKSLAEQWIDNKGYLPDVRIVAAMEKTKSNELIKFPTYVEDSGTISIAEIINQIPFDIKRMFWITGVPLGGIRGNHANKDTHEVLVCLNGSVEVTLDNKGKKVHFVLDKSSEGLFVKNKTWITMAHFSTNCILLVFASSEYNPKDRIDDYNSL